MSCFLERGLVEPSQRMNQCKYTARIPANMMNLAFEVTVVCTAEKEKAHHYTLRRTPRVQDSFKKP